MAELSYCLIDAFAEEPYTGNPAAVVLGADGLHDEQMKRIAREFNISETTFVSGSPTPEASIAIRWFTPSTEVQMCGHGTLAAVHTLIESGRFTTLVEEKGLILPIHTAGGVLTVRCEQVNIEGRSGFVVWLDLPAPVLKKKQCVPKLWAEYLGLPPEAFDLEVPSVQSQDGDVLVFIKELTRLLDAQPDFKALDRFSRQQRVRGWCLSSTNTLSAAINVHSRFFAPAVGINEDPVTGSVHGPLAVHMVNCGLVPLFGSTGVLSGAQSDSSGRAGLIRAVVVRQEDGSQRVRVGGQCTTVMRGVLMV